MPCLAGTEFTCSDGSCINNDLKCNEIVDCPNGEDESHCGEPFKISANLWIIFRFEGLLHAKKYIKINLRPLFFIFIQKTKFWLDKEHTLGIEQFILWVFNCSSFRSSEYIYTYIGHIYKSRIQLVEWVKSKKYLNLKLKLKFALVWAHWVKTC